MHISPMSEEFHDWLDECPVRWIRDKIDVNYVYYCFETPDNDEPSFEYDKENEE
jgi:hypothetical protein